MQTKINYYEILGIAKNASEEMIKSAYHAKALIWHPDKKSFRPWLSDKDELNATMMFQYINTAKEVLLDAKERALYNLRLLTTNALGIDEAFISTFERLNLLAKHNGDSDHCINELLEEKIAMQQQIAALTAENQRLKTAVPKSTPPYYQPSGIPFSQSSFPSYNAYPYRQRTQTSQQPTSSSTSGTQPFFRPQTTPSGSINTVSKISSQGLKSIYLLLDEKQRVLGGGYYFSRIALIFGHAAESADNAEKFREAWKHFYKSQRLEAPFVFNVRELHDDNLQHPIKYLSLEFRSEDLINLKYSSTRGETILATLKKNVDLDDAISKKYRMNDFTFSEPKVKIDPGLQDFTAGFRMK